MFTGGAQWEKTGLYFFSISFVCLFLKINVKIHLRYTTGQIVSLGRFVLPELKKIMYIFGQKLLIYGNICSVLHYASRDVTDYPHMIHSGPLNLWLNHSTVVNTNLFWLNRLKSWNSNCILIHWVLLSF